jgi:hypothetical protein
MCETSLDATSEAVKRIRTRPEFFVELGLGCQSVRTHPQPTLIENLRRLIDERSASNRFFLNDFAKCMEWSGIDPLRKWLSGRPMSVESVARAARCLGVQPQVLDSAGEAYVHTAPKKRRTRPDAINGTAQLADTPDTTNSRSGQGEEMELSESIDRVIEGLPLRLRARAREAARIAVATVMGAGSERSQSRKKARA